ncbi:cutinase family protein [Mycobacterium sp. 852002-51057_SCH5723018]|uniref:cutinase family protein n=1 Tax=Mycobacterium sp. 852002-51057_SCH5723018 TaxID=1834094 RepID=UPI00080222E4|nr:cutinase family protein [Mycobacterium sp. 852002-51057_SCH5723018]OBG26746.1 cutinase [Mycobacterium sp. 852002-51057_SCH5723018]
MIAREIPRFLAPAVVAASGLSASVVASAIPFASAEPCPDVQVVFARGTDDPPGLGPTGQAFVDSLRPRIGATSLDVYAVNYPATHDWTSAGEAGISDAGAHVVSMAHDCPNTKMVLGGYSQGAAVMGFVTSAAVPPGIDPATVPKPMDPEVANHVSSVVLYALPSDRAMSFFGAPPVVIGPLYQAKTIKVCAVEDPICADGMNFGVHMSYPSNGAVIDQGAAFAAGLLGRGSGGPTGAGPGAPTTIAGSPSPVGVAVIP